jgi:glycosyltransferase involved in cell wall biosynthesis
MRVASVITRLNIGGASPPVISLAVGLRARGHESVLAVGSPEPDEGTLEAEAAKAGATIVKIPGLRRNPHVARDARALAQLVALFRDFRPDVVATHMSKAGALGRVAARLTRAPVVVHTYHGKGFDVFPQGWRRSSALWAERVLARLATGNIVVSAKQQAEFLHLRVSPPHRLRVIRYGLDLDPFFAASRLVAPLRRELGFDDDVLLAGVVARVVAIKGQDVFLRAAARLREACPNLRFLVIGDGPFRPDCEALARSLGLGRFVQFLGWRRDIPEVLSALDLVVLPTIMDFEGTPVTLIEALAAGRAVVAADVGGVVDVVRLGLTGLLVPPNDPAALADAMRRLVADPVTRERFGRNGQELVRERYARDRMVTETETYYRELLEAVRP